jgi:hypothetical protein
VSSVVRGSPATVRMCRSSVWCRAAQALD